MKKLLILTRLRLLSAFLATCLLTTASLAGTAHALAHLNVKVGNTTDATVTMTGTSPDGPIGPLTCTSSCDYSWSGATTVTLSASSLPGRTIGWGGQTCDNGNSSSTCTFTIPDGYYPSAEAFYGYATYQGKLVFEGDGSGTVTSSVGGMSCSSSCTGGSFAAGTSGIKLSAIPASGSVFAGWDQPPSPADMCYLTMGKGGQPVGINTDSTCYLLDANAPTQIFFTAVPIFNKAPVASSTSTTTSSTKSRTTTGTPAPVAAVTAPGTPEAPVMDGVKIGGTSDVVKVSADTADTAKLPVNKPLVLSGKTIPNGVVTLTIHSTVRTVTVNADKDGNWAYTVTGLEAGQHHVEASVTDPVSHLTSKPVTIAAFTLMAAKTSSAGHSGAHQKNSSVLLFITAGAVVLSAGTGFAFWRLKSSRHPQTFGQQ